MRVFVTGATGALGRHLVPGLVAAGHEVTATTRTPGKVAQLRAAGAEPVVLDGLDREAVIAGRGGPRRVIAQGYAGPGPDKRSGGGLKTEEDPPDLRPIRSAVQGPAAIAYVDKTVPPAAPEGIVLRYGAFYGPGASDVLLEMVRKRQVPGIGGGAGDLAVLEITHAA